MPKSVYGMIKELMGLEDTPPPPPPGSDAFNSQLQQLDADLQSTLDNEVSQLRNPYREDLTALHKQALTLLWGGEILAGARAKLAELKKFRASSRPKRE